MRDSVAAKPCAALLQVMKWSASKQPFLRDICQVITLTVVQLCYVQFIELRRLLDGRTLLEDVGASRLARLLSVGIRTDVEREEAVSLTACLLRHQPAIVCCLVMPMSFQIAENPWMQPCCEAKPK